MDKEKKKTQLQLSVIQKRGIYFYTKLSINIYQRHRWSKDIKKNNEKLLFHCHILLANTCWDNASTIIKLLIIWRRSNRRTNIIFIAENHSEEAARITGTDSFLIFDVYVG